jgi:hypothetical protein
MGSSTFSNAWILRGCGIYDETCEEGILAVPHDRLATCGTRPSSEGKRDETVNTKPGHYARSRDKG